MYRVSAAAWALKYPGWKKEKAYLAVKIADYSRHPKENPMSIRRLTLWEGKKKASS